MPERRTAMLRRAAWLAAAGAALGAGAAEAQGWRTITSARQLQGAEPVAVEVEYGAGELEVAPARRAVLYEMEARYDERVSSPLAAYDDRARHLRLGLSMRDGKRKGINVREGARTRIGLTDQVPLALDLSFGAGEAELELGGLRLQRLEVATGASETRIRFDRPNPIRAERVQIRAGAADLVVLELGNARARHVDFQGGVGSTTLDFSGVWDQNATASVQMGIGAVKLRFPRGLGVRINRSSFLTSFDPGGLVKRGSSYYSPNWDSAEHRLDLDLSAAFGSVEVEWVG